MAEDFTSRFKIDISDLQKNIRQAQDEIKTANATFKAETAGMDAWSKNADGLASKIKSLETVLGSQKTILASYQSELSKNQEAYEENGKRADELRKKLTELRESGVEKSSAEYQKYETALKSVVKEQEKNSKAVSDLKLKVLQQKAAVGETEGALRKYETAQEKVAADSRSLTKTIETQEKDLKDLKARYADVIAAEGKNSSTAKDLEKQIRGLSTVLDANQKEMDQSRAEADKLDASFGKAEKSTDGLAAKLSAGLKAGLAAIGTAAVSAVAGLAAASRSTAAYADDILTLSAQTGIATDQLEGYKYAADLIDVSMETMTGSMARNIKQMNNAAAGSKTAVAAYDKLGVSVTDAEGNLRDSETVYWEVISALGEIDDETARDAAAMDIFGKSAQELNPLIQAGAEKVKELTEEARDMGAIMGGDALKQAGEFDDSIQRLKGTATGAKNALGMVLMPALKGLADDGTRLLGEFTRGLNAAGGDWEKISKVISSTVEGAAGVLMERLPKIIETGINIATSLIKALTDSKVIKGITKTLIQAIPQVVEAAVQLFGGIISAIPEVVTTLVEELPQIAFAVIDSLKNAAGDVADAAMEFFFGVVNESKIAQQELDNAGKAAGDYVAALKATEPDLVDYNKIFSETGKLAGELDDDIKTAEDAITEILRKAFEDQDGLRKADIEAIVEYNAEIKRLQAEKLGIYQGVQNAQITVIESEGQLSAEQAAQYLADTRSSFEESNKVADDAYKERLTAIEQYWASQGLVGSVAYKTEIAAAKTAHDEQLAENKAYYDKALGLIGNHAKEWVTTDAQKWADLNNAAEGWRKASEDEFSAWILAANDWVGSFDKMHDEYRDVLSSIDKNQSAAFLNMVATVKSNGGEIDSETQEIVTNMLGAFAGLPEGFQDVGKETLLGLTEGIQDEIPGLENAASMTVDEIVNTIMTGLDIHSPSKVTEQLGAYTVQGMAEGLIKGLPLIKRASMDAAGAMTDTMIGKIRDSLPTFYAAGQRMVDSIQKGILSREATLQTELASMLGRVSANLSVSANVTGGGRASGGNTVNNYTQVINAPEAPSRIELYRQTKNLLNLNS